MIITQEELAALPIAEREKIEQESYEFHQKMLNDPSNEIFTEFNFIAFEQDSSNKSSTGSFVSTYR
jgi:hypothetical protein